MSNVHSINRIYFVISVELLNRYLGISKTAMQNYCSTIQYDQIYGTIEILRYIFNDGTKRINFVCFIQNRHLVDPVMAALIFQIYRYMFKWQFIRKQQQRTRNRHFLDRLNTFNSLLFLIRSIHFCSEIFTKYKKLLYDEKHKKQYRSCPFFNYHKIISNIFRNSMLYWSYFGQTVT